MLIQKEALSKTPLLLNKTIVITGASRGIGKAIARTCAREGACVGINYFKSKTSAEGLAQEIHDSFEVNAYPLEFDVRDPAAIAKTCAPLLANGGVDGWVNNAGVNRHGLLPTQTDEMIQEQIGINMAGPIFCSRFIIPHMMSRKGGSIVNIGSIVSSTVGPGQAVYAATKGALVSLTRALAYEYGRKGIRVNCVEPGPIDTDMFAETKELAGEEIKRRIPLRRLGAPEDVAELVAFLLSSRASYMTGGQFRADGGYTLG